ncbi:MAG: hypothetical protein JHD16_01460 [Solirubrobacteraceae bacterium]|nr:hypothetical protein [Solirubrobacteraceae bacterium]
MALHTDIPTRAEISRLLETHEPWCVSIYVPTTPVTPDADAGRIALKNEVASAVAALHEAGAPKKDVAAIDEALTDLVDDYDFWAVQSHSLAVFATPTSVRTFRLPNKLSEASQVADRFYVKPLLRSTTFAQAAYVLELAQGSVRLLEVAPDLPPSEVHVPGLPTDIASSVGKASVNDRSAVGRLQGSEGQKVRMRQYSRAVDNALRGVLAGLDLPLILAAAQPLDAIYRSVNTYPHLIEHGIAGNPETTGDTELADAARTVLDELYAADLAALKERFEARLDEGRAAVDVVDIARAATFGAVDTLFADIDTQEAGTIDPSSGAVTYAGGDGDGTEYGVVDEIARRVLLSGGRVLAVRADEVPGGGSASAILRYPV